MAAATTSTDHAGREFVSFAVDIRNGDNWKDEFHGCVYKGTSDIYVKRGDEYRPAELLRGKDVKPLAGVCLAAARSLPGPIGASATPAAALKRSSWATEPLHGCACPVWVISIHVAI